ncbi:MAG: hypothetical protein ABIH23_12500 [bacterium]
MSREVVESKQQSAKVMDKLRKIAGNLGAGGGQIAALALKPSEAVVTISHVFQNMLNEGFLRGLLNEWKDLVEKWSVKEDYPETEQGKSCLHELLKALDQDLPDERRFSILKAIFFAAASESNDLCDEESPLPLQFIQITRTLTVGEILALEAVYRIATAPTAVVKEIEKDKQDRKAWLESIAKESGLKYTEIVEQHADGLSSKGLLRPRPSHDAVLMGQDPRYWLTQFGEELCRFITYHKEEMPGIPEQYTEENSAVFTHGGRLYGFADDLAKSPKDYLRFTEKSKSITSEWPSKNRFDERLNKLGYSIAWAPNSEGGIESQREKGTRLIYEINESEQTLYRLVYQDGVLMAKKTQVSA